MQRAVTYAVPANCPKSDGGCWPSRAKGVGIDDRPQATDRTAETTDGALPQRETAMATRAPTSNQILMGLSSADSELLDPHLEAVDLPVRTVLEARRKPVQYVYFMESGFASVVANGQFNIEVGIIGREGMSGLSVVLGSTDNPANETFMQIGGSGQAIEAHRLARRLGPASPASRPATLRSRFPGANLADCALQWPKQDRRTPSAVVAHGRGSRPR